MGASFFTEEELKKVGFASYGQNVLVSRKASIYSPHKMHLGSNVRIDDFSFLNGEIHLEDYIHIGAYCLVIAGKSKIHMHTFTTLASKVSVYGISDDYSGESLTNPMVPDSFKKLVHGDVTIHRHSIIGASSIILPGVVVGEGCAVGAMTLVNKSIDPWGIYVGIPARRIKDRKDDLLELEQQFYREMEKNHPHPIYRKDE